MKARHPAKPVSQNAHAPHCPPRPPPPPRARPRRRSPPRLPCRRVQTPPPRGRSRRLVSPPNTPAPRTRPSRRTRPAAAATPGTRPRPTRGGAGSGRRRPGPPAGPSPESTGPEPTVPSPESRVRRISLAATPWTPRLTAPAASSEASAPWRAYSPADVAAIAHRRRLAVMRGVNVRARDGALEFGFADSRSLRLLPPPNVGPHELPLVGTMASRGTPPRRTDAPARAGPSTRVLRRRRRRRPGCSAAGRRCRRASPPRRGGGGDRRHHRRAGGAAPASALAIRLGARGEYACSVFSPEEAGHANRRASANRQASASSPRPQRPPRLRFHRHFPPDFFRDRTRRRASSYPTRARTCAPPPALNAPRASPPAPRLLLVPRLEVRDAARPLARRR